MYRKMFLFLILAVLSVKTVTAQDTISGGRISVSSVTDEKTELSSENKKRVSEILRETSAATAMLQSPDNRITYTLKTAAVLWKIDEKEARSLMSAAMNDVRQIIIETDNEMNRFENSVDYAGSSGDNDLWQKTNQITTFRSSIINQVSNLDAELGLTFLRETMRTVTNQELRTRIEANDKYLETMLIGKIAEKTPTRALELGRKKLVEGFDPEAVSLLQTMYEKDKEKGAAFAEDLLKQLKSASLNSDSTWVLSSLFDSGVINFEQIASEKLKDKPMFTEQALRDLATMLAKQIIDPLNATNYFEVTPEFQGSMQKYAPQYNGQFKKLAELQRLRSERDKTEPEKSSDFNNAVQKIQESQTKFQGEIDTKVQGLSGENVTSEQRKKIIEEAQSKIFETPDRSVRFSSLISLAMQAASVGEKESAAAILEESERLINLQPKEMKEFMEVWALAKGYSAIKPEKSFALLEDTIFRLNEIINAYVKFNEFQSGELVIEKGELKMNDYGGQMFGFFTSTGDSIGKLAEADFARTKNLADKFERAEFRVETRLMIATTLSQSQFNITKVDSVARQEKSK